MRPGMRRASQASPAKDRLPCLVLFSGSNSLMYVVTYQLQWLPATMENEQHVLVMKPDDIRIVSTTTELLLHWEQAMGVTAN